MTFYIMFETGVILAIERPEHLKPMDKEIGNYALETLLKFGRPDAWTRKMGKIFKEYKITCKQITVDEFNAIRMRKHLRVEL